MVDSAATTTPATRLELRFTTNRITATLHAKMSRKKLDKLDIEKICEEILNPSVPMPLRISAILMNGVVIAYQRKVQLLYVDALRLQVKINQAWKVKSAPDRTVAPRRKLQAKKEAVTLPQYQEGDAEDVEQILNYSDGNTRMDFQHHTAYFAMGLDTVDENLINQNDGEEGETDNLHQADAANITLPEHFDLFQTHTGPFNHFERFDIEGDDDFQMNFASGERTPIRSSLIPSPPHPREAEEIIHDQYPDDRANQPSEEIRVDNQEKQRPRPAKRKTRRSPALVMDYEHTVVPGHIYQSWLQDTSDITSKRGRNRKPASLMSTMKIGELMELPPVVLGSGLLSETREIQYPPALMELWMISNQPPHLSTPARNSPPLPPEPSSASPRDVGGFQDFPPFPVGGGADMHSGASSGSFVASAENIRNPIQLPKDQIPPEFAAGGPTPNLKNNEFFPEIRSISPASYGDGPRSDPSAASGFDSGRANRKRPHSSSRLGGSGGLETVAEEHIWSKSEPNFGGLTKVAENGASPDQELLVETGPTQTPAPPFTSPASSKLTETIHKQMKAHFDTPGAPRVESLNQLTTGMNRKGAAMLFYQTCVLATKDVLKVEQKVPYGDILISKGANM